MKSGWTHLQLVLVATLLSAFSAEYSHSGDPVPNSSSATAPIGTPVTGGHTKGPETNDQRVPTTSPDAQPVQHQATVEFGPLQTLRFGELKPYAKKRTPNRAPAWTNQQTHDPGTTSTEANSPDLRPETKDTQSRNVAPTGPGQ